MHLVYGINIRIVNVWFSAVSDDWFVCVCVISVRIWDVRPYAPHERCVKIMSGHQHTFEKVNQWNIVSLFSFVVCFCFSLWLLLLLFWWRILSVHQDKTCFLIA